MSKFGHHPSHLLRLLQKPDHLVMGFIVAEGGGFQMFVVKQYGDLLYLAVSWNSKLHEISVLISSRRVTEKNSTRIQRDLNGDLRI